MPTWKPGTYSPYLVRTRMVQFAVRSPQTQVFPILPCASLAAILRASRLLETSMSEALDRYVPCLPILYVRC